jgi:hypothetical protein
MTKVRLTWCGQGALDLSHLTTDEGLPLMFAAPGCTAVVSTDTTKHPLLSSFLKPLGDLHSVDAESPEEPLVAAPSPEPPPPEPVPEKESTPAPAVVSEPEPEPEPEPAPEPDKPKPGRGRGRERAGGEKKNDK